MMLIRDAAVMTLGGFRGAYLFYYVLCMHIWLVRNYFPY